MALKTFNFDGDAYIEGEDTRAEIGAIISKISGNGFFGTISQVGSTNTFTVKSGSTIFIGGLCVRVLSDESFDLTSNKYIVVETTFSTASGAYACVLKSVNVITAGKVGTVNKQVIIYEKGVGVANEGSGLVDLLGKSMRATRFFNGSSYMDEGQSISFPNLLANNYQLGILFFSHYTVGTGADNWGWAAYPVLVKQIELMSGQGHAVPIPVTGTTKTAYKYVYIGLERISGNAQNVQTLDGINFRSYCLREFWGVG